MWKKQLHTANSQTLPENNNNNSKANKRQPLAEGKQSVRELKKYRRLAGMWRDEFMSHWSIGGDSTSLTARTSNAFGGLLNRKQCEFVLDELNDDMTFHWNWWAII